VSKTKTTMQINHRTVEAVSGKFVTDVANDNSPHAKSVKKHSVAAPIKAHQPVRSKTLMRHVVKKPSGSDKRLRAVSQVESGLQSVALGVVKTPEHFKSKHLAHAKHIAKSASVKHFSDNISLSSFVPTMPSVSVAKPSPKRVEPAKSTTVADLLERAINASTSHEQPPYNPPKKHRKIGLLRRRSMRHASSY